MNQTQLPIFLFGVTMICIYIFFKVYTDVRNNRIEFQRQANSLDRAVLVELYELKNRCPDLADLVDSLIEFWRDEKNIES